MSQLLDARNYVFVFSAFTWIKSRDFYFLLPRKHHHHHHLSIFLSLVYWIRDLNSATSSREIRQADRIGDVSCQLFLFPSFLPPVLISAISFWTSRRVCRSLPLYIVLSRRSDFSCMYVASVTCGRAPERKKKRENKGEARGREDLLPPPQKIEQATLFPCGRSLR